MVPSGVLAAVRINVVKAVDGKVVLSHVVVSGVVVGKCHTKIFAMSDVPTWRHGMWLAR
jgi:hypothetical protein